MKSAFNGELYSVIYIITNTVNGKRYIGKTTRDIEVRWYHHCKTAEYGSNTYLHRAISKYGPPAFVVERLCDGLDEEEILMIAEHQPEYNMTSGGTGGDMSDSPNWRDSLKRRNYKGENNPNYGKLGKDSPNYGKKRTEEQKENYRKGYKGKRIPVRVHGINYESVSRASKVLGRSERYIRLHDEINEWKY